MFFSALRDCFRFFLDGSMLFLGGFFKQKRAAWSALLSEALLLRTMESLSEQILHCDSVLDALGFWVRGGLTVQSKSRTWFEGGLVMWDWCKKHQIKKPSTFREQR